MMTSRATSMVRAQIIGIALIVGLLLGCSAPGMPNEEVATLRSLEQVDDHPLYTMRHYGAYEQRLTSAASVNGWPLSGLPRQDLMTTLPAWASGRVTV